MSSAVPTPAVTLNVTTTTTIAESYATLDAAYARCQTLLKQYPGATIVLNSGAYCLHVTQTPGK